MTTIWEVPVATTTDLAVAVPRRLYRALEPYPLPRDARPSRARHERLPEPLRVSGAASRIRS
jgi:hypothetical protein